MNDTDKLRVLIPHWIEHNEEHAEEFRHWSEKAGDAAAHILSAARAITDANASLSAALEKLGGPLQLHDYQIQHEHHEHHEHHGHHEPHQHHEHDGHDEHHT